MQLQLWVSLTGTIVLIPSLVIGAAYAGPLALPGPLPSLRRFALHGLCIDQPPSASTGTAIRHCRLSPPRGFGRYDLGGSQVPSVPANADGHARLVCVAGSSRGSW